MKKGKYVCLRKNSIFLFDSEQLILERLEIFENEIGFSDCMNNK